jgi:uncharacterized Zn-binding protein involved in type VI secretion
MPRGPAARILDPVMHPVPGMLTPGPGSFNVIIGGKLAWRGVPFGAAAGIKAAKATSDTTIQAAEAATTAATGTPGYAAAKAAELTAKAAAVASLGATFAASGADIHTCATPLLPPPPHGPGVVLDGSPTVFINSLAACRQGDTVTEALGPPDQIVLGLPTVIIGDAPSYSSQAAAALAALGYANPQSIASNLENVGFIYQNPDGSFSFTLAGGTDAGGSLSNAPLPPGTTEVGFFHCHGDYSLQNPITGNAIRTSNPALDSYNSDNFSGTDLNTASGRAAASANPGAYRSYLGTPSGGFRVDNPSAPAATRVSNFP